MHGRAQGQALQCITTTARRNFSPRRWNRARLRQIRRRHLSVEQGLRGVLRQLTREPGRDRVRHHLLGLTVNDGAENAQIRCVVLCGTTSCMRTLRCTVPSIRLSNHVLDVGGLIRRIALVLGARMGGGIQGHGSRY